MQFLAKTAQEVDKVIKPLSCCLCHLCTIFTFLIILFMTVSCHYLCSEGKTSRMHELCFRHPQLFLIGTLSGSSDYLLVLTDLHGQSINPA